MIIICHLNSHTQVMICHLNSQTQVIGDMRKKHQETLDDFGDQLEQMQKAKTKVDREKVS